MAASYKGCKDVVRLLLDYGAVLNLQQQDGSTSLLMASTWGHWEVVKILLDHGAEINMTNINGFTALLKASYCGHKDVVQVLLDHGDDVNATRHYDGSTALMLASSNGHKQVVELSKCLVDMKLARLAGNMNLADSATAAWEWALARGAMDQLALLGIVLSFSGRAKRRNRPLRSVEEW